jgi:hypothetical protein
VRSLIALSVLSVLLAPTARLEAQVVVPPPDSALADSLHRRPDTLLTTDQRIKIAALGQVQLQPAPLVGVGALQPPGARQVFTRDSIDWIVAQTVGDLLATVPGVFLQRGGGFGRPEMPTYRGRGAGSVVFVVDGMPYDPVGHDTLAVDPSFFSLALFDRMEIVASPSVLRVQLWTRRHDRQAPRTKIGFSTGDLGMTRYLASFERRYPSGWGLSLASDYFGINAPPGGSGASRVTNAFAQLGYLPTAHFGIQAQVLVQAIRRDVLLSDGTDVLDTLTDALKGTRTDGQVRATWHRHDSGLGPQIDVIAGRTTWRGDSVSRSIGQVGAIAAYREPTWSAELTAWHRTEWTPVDARLALGWTPLERISGSLELTEQRHRGDRNSSWATVRAGVRMPLGLVASATISDGHRVQLPSVRDDSARGFTDYGASLGFDRRRVGLDLGYVRNDAWHPVAFPEFRRIPLVGSQPVVEWASVHARLAVLGWLTLESRFDHPLNNRLPDGAPPRHSFSTATINSRFLHNFPSGIFRLKVQGVMENWSQGIAGRDTAGVAIALPAATYFRGVLQLQIGPFIAFWDRANMRASKAGYLPGYRLPSLMSTYGVRWEFAN